MGYLDEAKFAENPDPRCPCVLLLDTSSSMYGPSINALNHGLVTFQEAISRPDSLARRRVEVAIITFGNGGVQVLQDFVTAEVLQAPTLTTGGSTPMGEAINLALDKLRDFKTILKQTGTAYYRPWIFMITDGEPDDGWQRAAQRLRDEEAQRGVAFFAVGVAGANMQKLSQIAVPTRRPVILDGLKFDEMFVWLSNSMERTSISKPGENVALPPVDGWAVV